MVDYTLSNNALQIRDSYKVEDYNMNVELNLIRIMNSSKKYDILNRTNDSLINEWETHNLCYDLGILRSHTKDVDFEYPQKWYFKVLYWIGAKIHEFTE